MADIITSSPSGTPANYSDPSITRYGLISGLNIINVHAYDKFKETYGFVPYASLAQILGNEEEIADNKQFTWYQSHGRALGFVQSAAAVTVSAGAPATITVAAGGYTASGTKSLPALGMIFRNARTGVQSRVSAAPNKATANAHTFVLTPVVAAKNASTLLGDELLCEGFKYLGEASDKTDTIIQNVDKYSNYCTQIRVDDTISDLASAERMEFQINGKYSYITKQQRDTDLRLMRELDLLIMEGTQTDNLPYVEEGSNGLIKQVQANGVNGTYTAWSLATFATMERALTAVGAPKEFDVLSDNAAYIEMQNSIFTEINNGAIVFGEAGSRGGIDLNRDFQSLKIYGRKYNFTNYGLFDQQTTYGSAGLGDRNRFSLLLATGSTGASTASGSTVSKARFTVMNQRPFGCNKWHTKENGLFSDGGGTKAENINTTIGYFGSRLIGAQQCMIMKGV